MTQNTRSLKWSDVMEQDHTDDDDVDESTTKKMRTIPTIPTDNRFDALTIAATTSNAGNCQQQQHKINVTNADGSKEARASPKKVRIPPITIIGKKRNEVAELCRKAGVSDKTVMFKLTSIGINVITSDVDTFTKLRDLFKTNSHCFSHNLPDEKWQKIVLKGLFRMDINDLKKELSEKNITPEDVKIMTPKKRKFDDQAHYLLFFKKRTTTITELHKCRSFCYLKVEWEYYTPKKFGPTQCHKCQMFGHGSRHCTMPAKCLFCAGGHEARQCLGVVNGAPIEGFKYKCANCNGDHKANDEACPNLKRFLEIQEEFMEKNARRNNSRNPKLMNRINAEFPPMPRLRKPSDNFLYSQPRPTTSSYAGLFSNQAQHGTNTPG